MLSIIVPTYNSERTLEKTLKMLVPPPYAREIIVVDGGSQDQTCQIAKKFADKLVPSAKGRGQQLQTGATHAQGDWLLFLHSDTVLSDDWAREIAQFMVSCEHEEKAAYFTFALDDQHDQAQRLEKIVSFRCKFFGLPYGDQGLLISRELYDQIGGYKNIPLMEDVDIVRRLGKSRLQQLSVKAITSAAKYRRDGYWQRSCKNMVCLALYFLGVSPKQIVKLYG